MAAKKLVLILNSSHDYIKHTGTGEKTFAAVSNKLFMAISQTYIPVLKMLEKLEAEKISFKMGIVLSPVLCTLLDDAEEKQQYLNWVENRISLGEKEIKRLERPDASDNERKFLLNAKESLKKAQDEKDYFDQINGKILKKFVEFQKKGLVELIATCGTDIFFPHYNDLTEVMNAQVETGIYAYRNFFGEVPEGFWLPEMGYYPGVEKVLRSYNMNYTVLDARSFLFSEKEPVKGIFYPARFDNALVAFGRDPFSDGQIFGEAGYSKNPVYCACTRDAGYELSSEDLKDYIEEGMPRYSFNYKYWNKENSENNVYDGEKALLQVKSDAHNFAENKKELISKAQETLGQESDICLVMTVNADQLRNQWVEGIDWIEHVIREFSTSEVELSLPKDIVSNPFELQRVKPYYGSSCGEGYGENLLSNKNSWMMRYVRKASERMVDLADRFPSDTGLKARLLNLGAKELLLIQSCGWSKMIETEEFPEYARDRFVQGLNDFTAVFDALGSNTVSTEWLTKLEIEHQIFPWMNYRIFSKKR